MHDSTIEKIGSLGQAIEKVKKPYFPKLIARFPWARAQASSAASKPLCSHICVADASQMNVFS
ncbi:hypothetical protein BBI11_13500 [Planococcus maritimus]|nr:hypothetical protein BBI11_13500 [Planococcus maritimus]